MNWKYLVVIQVLPFVWCQAVNEEGRPKRVIHGEILVDRRNAEYASPKYYVWIGSVPGVPADPGSGFWKSENLICGGALLTHQIVQSACHCYVDWQSPRSDGVEWHTWISRDREAVVRCSEIKFPRCEADKIEKYMIHPFCRKVWGWVSHDYSLLTLKSPVKLSATVTTAPVYKLEDMYAMWSRFISNEAVCMIMGFGEFISLGNQTKSKVLRHGWQVIRSYQECYGEYSISSKSAKKVTMGKYKEFATWTCLKPFGKELGTGQEALMGRSDSGGPITCDNKFFALASNFADHPNTNDIIYYAYANSDDYRSLMVEEMMDPDKIHCHRDHSVPPNVIFHRDAAPQNFHASLSSRQTNLKSNYAFHTTTSFLIIIFVGNL